MNATTLQIVIESGLVLLLAATLLRAWRLERALGALRRDRGALDTLVQGFRGASEAAEQSVTRLRQVGTETGRDLARRIEHAGALREDLGFITKRAEEAADRLEQLVRDTRAVQAGPGRAFAQARPPAPLAADAAVPEPAERPRSAAERDLLRALKLVR